MQLQVNYSFNVTFHVSLFSQYIVFNTQYSCVLQYIFFHILWLLYEITNTLHISLYSFIGISSV